MTPQMLLPGLWVYCLDKPHAYYISHANGATAVLLREQAVNETVMHDSHHSMFTRLHGIPLDRDILTNSFGFSPALHNDSYMFRQIYKEIKVLRGDNLELVKPSTNLFIDIDESGKRFTTYLECGDNKIYLSELSHVHELQILLYAHTYAFPFINKLVKDKTTE